MSKPFQIAGIVLIVIGVIVLMVGYGQAKGAYVTDEPEGGAGGGTPVPEHHPSTETPPADEPWHPTPEDETPPVFPEVDIPEQGGLNILGFDFNIIELIAVAVIIIGFFLMSIP